MSRRAATGIRTGAYSNPYDPFEAQGDYPHVTHARRTCLTPDDLEEIEEEVRERNAPRRTTP